MIAMLDTLKEENNKSKKKREKRNLTTNTMRTDINANGLLYFFSSELERGGSHASKEKNNKNLDEKKYSKQKSPTLLTAILQKCAKGTEVENTRKRKGKGMQQYMLHDWENFQVEKKEKGKKSIWQ
jgi:hypothetical protein